MHCDTQIQTYYRFKFKADAVERTAHVRHICELEKQITALADEILAYEKQVLFDDISVYRIFYHCSTET